MNFRLRPLEASTFAKLFELDQAALELIGARKMTVDQHPGFPCRVSLEDASLGEEVILLTYQHHKVHSPYQASGPIFVRASAPTATLAVNEIPKMFYHRLLSLRGYDQHGTMQTAVVAEGRYLREQILSMFEEAEIAYIHLHNAKPGCFNCVVERA